MTSKQISQAIYEALSEIDFQNFNMCQQISELTEDFENGSIEPEDLKDEIESALDNEDFGEYLAAKVVASLVKSIQSE